VKRAFPKIIAGSDRVGAFWLAFFVMILLSWMAFFRMAFDAPFSGLPGEVWEALCAGRQSASFPALLGMWALMVAGMMLPTFVPSLLTFLNPGHVGATRPTEALVLVSGYATVWIAFSVAAAGAQLGFATLEILTPNAESTSPWLTSALLFGAGAYQFSLLKAACLSKCRMPLAFFLERWAPGSVRAFRMGVELGARCLGCC
jgi:predicted metal-binding membrane protein